MITWGESRLEHLSLNQRLAELERERDAWRSIARGLQQRLKDNGLHDRLSEHEKGQIS